MVCCLLLSFFNLYNCDKCSFPSKKPPVSDRYSSACARNVASFLKGVTYRDGSAADDLQQMLGLEKRLRNAQKGSALTSMFQPALLLQDSCESCEILKHMCLMKMASLTLSGPSVCIILVFLAWVLSIFCIHFSHVSCSVRSCINLWKKPVQTIPTLLEASSRNCAHLRNHERVRSSLSEFSGVILTRTHIIPGEFRGASMYTPEHSKHL